MKYIRTKDGRIIAIPNQSKIILYDDEKLAIDTTKKGHTCIYGFVEKQADTIEQLIDKFVCGQTILRSKEDAFIATGIEVKIPDIYGAIWTDKGLIYVAKMNDKGELELL